MHLTSIYLGSIFLPTWGSFGYSDQKIQRFFEKCVYNSKNPWKNYGSWKKNVSPQKKGYNEKQEYEVVGNYVRKRAILQFSKIFFSGETFFQTSGG